MSKFYKWTPIKERVLNTIEHKLAEISEDSDYALNIAKVERSTIVPNLSQHLEPDSLRIFQVGDVPDEDAFQSTHHEAHLMTIEIWLFGSSLEFPDEEFNYLEAAVIHALKRGPVYDRYHPYPKMAEIEFDRASGRPVTQLALQRAGIGIAKWEVKFRHIINDPYRWDSCDIRLDPDDLEKP